MRLARKPANVSWEEAAAVPIAATTALQALRDKGNVQPGQKVLINGASGGVGTYAVQLAKAFGADVTAVCSTANVELARSLGADRVVDYTEEDFTKLGERHDLMLDIAGSRPFRAFRRVLTPDATVVVVGAKFPSSRGLGPLSHMLGTRLAAVGRSQTVKLFIAKIEQEDLLVLQELLESGKVRSVIDRSYELARGGGRAPVPGRGARAREGRPHRLSVDASRLRDLTLELVECQSPTGDTADVARLYARRLEELGLEVETPRRASSRRRRSSSGACAAASPGRRSS